MLEGANFHGIFIADVLGGYDVYKASLEPAIASGAQCRSVSKHIHGYFVRRRFAMETFLGVSTRPEGARSIPGSPMSQGRNLSDTFRLEIKLY